MTQIKILLYRKNYLLGIVYIIILMLGCTGCGCQSYTSTNINNLKKPQNIQSIILNNNKSFELIIREIRTELHAIKINVYNNEDNISYQYNEDIPCLSIIQILEDHVTTSLFQNGQEAGYQLILKISAKLLISNTCEYPINVCIYRDFLKDSQEALSNDIFENNIRIEMYQEAAQKIIYRILLFFNIH